ncbi:S1C family serine protease [Humitalea sp. 24SJ18S-53]|uniref:S1C family serine protease n=1 Tax=Humitalea sp. 24SJ18S-53 TaxID=3422307 RepID=UPI003D674AD1
MTTPLPRRFFLALPAVMMLPGAGCAQRGLSASGSPLPDFADLAERVLPAVVNIAVQGEPGTVPPELRGTPFERYFRDRRGRQQMSGAGSGFIIDPTGLVVTNNHVLGSSTRVVVGLQDGTQLPARVVGTDDLTDLALLKVEASVALPTVGFGSSSAMRVGAWVLAAGNPFGLGGSVTSGIVSARGRDIGTGPFDDFLQTDAAINPGNSGGPLFNLAGEVIGINTAIYSPSGASAGVGFATPSDLARNVIEQLRRDGRVDRGWLGVAVQDLVPEPGQRGRRGVLVQGVERNSPAARAGLRQGDLVTALNGETLDTSRALIRSVAGTAPGQSVRLTYQRDGRSQEVSVQVARRPAAAN